MFKSSTPVDSCRRYIFGIDDAVAVPALIKGGSEILGSIFGAGSAVQSSRAALQGVRETNQTNLQIAQETNEQNYKIWQEEKQHNYDMWKAQSNQEWDMWNAENEYNSAAAQRERLEEAGYNPYLAIGGMSGNLATGMTNPSMNATHPPTMQAPTMQAPTRDMYASPLSIAGDTFSSVLPMFQALADLEKTSADTTKALADAGKSRSETASIDWQTNFNKSTEGIKRRGLELLNDQLQSDIDLKNAQRLLTNANRETVDILNQWLPMEKQVSYLTSVQNLYNLYLEGKFTMAQIRKIGTSMLVDMAQVRNLNAQTKLYGAQTNYVDAQTYGQKVENSYATAAFNDLLKQCANQTLISDHEVISSHWRSGSAYYRYLIDENKQYNLDEYGREEYTPGILGGLVQDVSFPFVNMLR